MSRTLLCRLADGTARSSAMACPKGACILRRTVMSSRSAAWWRCSAGASRPTGCTWAALGLVTEAGVMVDLCCRPTMVQMRLSPFCGGICFADQVPCMAVNALHQLLPHRQEQHSTKADQGIPSLRTLPSEAPCSSLARCSRCHPNVRHAVHVGNRHPTALRAQLAVRRRSLRRRGSSPPPRPQDGPQSPWMLGEPRAPRPLPQRRL